MAAQTFRFWWLATKRLLGEQLADVRSPLQTWRTAFDADGLTWARSSIQADWIADTRLAWYAAMVRDA